MPLENFKLPLFESEIDYLLKHKKNLEKIITQYQAQRFIFEIESLYLKIKNLGSFTYEVLPNRREPHMMVTICDSFYNTPEICFSVSMYKNNGQEKDHPDDIRNARFALRKIIPYMEKSHSLNIFGGIKRKERFDVYDRIADMYNMQGFKKVISLLRRENSLESVNLNNDKIKNVLFDFEVNKEKFNFYIPEYAGSVDSIDKNFIFSDTAMNSYKKIVTEIEKLVLYKLGFELQCYINIYNNEPLPLIHCGYTKNDHSLIIKRDVSLNGIDFGNEYYSPIKKCLDDLQETSICDFVFANFNFGHVSNDHNETDPNKKYNIHQGLNKIMAYKNSPTDLELLKEIIQMAHTYSDIQKEKIKIMQNIGNDEIIKPKTRRL